MSKKDADLLVRDLRAHFTAAKTGHTIEKRGGHWHVFNAAGNHLIGFASTPGDSRFRNNVVARLRQRGIVPRDWR